MIIACRDMERGDAARKEVIEVSGNQNVVCKKLDLADLSSIRQFAQNINSGKTLKRLDSSDSPCILTAYILKKLEIYC